MAKTISVKMQVVADTKGIQQYNAALKSAVTASKQAEGGVKQLAGSFNDLSSMLNTAVFGMSAMAIVDLGVKMYNQGYQVNTAAIAFRAYARAIGDADDMMKRLRAGTGNVITDFDLMTFSAELMGLNIARTDDALIEMVSNVAKLASLKPGMSLAEGMEAFVRVMRNGASSFRMLDNIGISATRVKQILAEMGEPLSNQVAYGQAVLEAIREKLDQVGDAAGRAYTPVNRLLTNIQNLANEVSSRFTIGLEGTVGLIEIALGQNPIQVQNFESSMELYDKFIGELEKVSDIVDYIEPQLDGSKETVGAFLGTLSEGWKNALSDMERNDIVDLAVEKLGLSNETVTTINQAEAALTSFFDSFVAADEAAAKLAMLRDVFKDIKTTIGGGISGVSQYVTSQFSYSKMLEPIQGMLNSLHMGSFDWRDVDASMFANLNKFQIDRNTPQYMRQSDADLMWATAEQAARNLIDAKAQLDAELISPEQYDVMKGIADNAKLFADEAQRAADAFAKMKLADLFGQTGGGRLGEWLGNIADVMGSKATPYVQDRFSLATGQENNLSLLIRDTIDPFLAELAELDPDMVITVVNNMNAALEEMSRLGWTVDQKTASLMTYWNNVVVPGATAMYGANITQGANTFEITKGMSAGQAAAAAGMSVEQLLNAYGFKDAKSVLPGTYTKYPNMGMGGGIDALANIDPSLMMGLNQFAQSELPTAQPLADNLTTANTEVKPMQDVFATTEKHINNMVTKMNQLTSETQLVRIQFKVFGTEQWLQELLITKKIIVNAEFASGSGDGGGFGTTGLKSDSKTPVVPLEPTR